MKKQSITVDLPLNNNNNEDRLKLAAKAAKNAKAKRKSRISENEIIRETDETKQEELSMMQRALDNDEEGSDNEEIS